MYYEFRLKIMDNFTLDNLWKYKIFKIVYIHCFYIKKKNEEGLSGIMLELSSSHGGKAD